MAFPPAPAALRSPLTVSVDLEDVDALPGEGDAAFGGAGLGGAKGGALPETEKCLLKAIGHSALVATGPCWIQAGRTPRPWRLLERRATHRE